jgi:hypothetical protein
MRALLLLLALVLAACGGQDSSVENGADAPIPEAAEVETTSASPGASDGAARIIPISAAADVDPCALLSDAEYAGFVEAPLPIRLRQQQVVLLVGADPDLVTVACEWGRRQGSGVRIHLGGRGMDRLTRGTTMEAVPELGEGARMVRPTFGNDPFLVVPVGDRTLKIWGATRRTSGAGEDQRKLAEYTAIARTVLPKVDGLSPFAPASASSVAGPDVDPCVLLSPEDVGAVTGPVGAVQLAGSQTGTGTGSDYVQCRWVSTEGVPMVEVALRAPAAFREAADNPIRQYADGPSIGGAPSLIGEATVGHHILIDKGTYVLDVGALVDRDQRDRIEAILERLATSAHSRL